MADTFDEKVFDPTPHRRQQARADGHVARSGELTSAGILLGGLMALVFTGAALYQHLCALLTGALGGQSWQGMLRSGTPPDADMLAGQWSSLVAGLAGVLLPPLVLVALVAIALNVVQTGFLFLPHKLVPDVSRASPLAGLKRIVSAASAVRLSLGLVKLAIVAGVAFGSVYHRREELAAIGWYDLPQVVAFAWDICLWTCLKVASALVILALFDYGYERWKHERELRLSPQELREEMRNLQGNPQIAARRRSAARQPAARWQAAVAAADVVIVDQAKAAVAIQYVRGTMAAPVVLAKGLGPMAARLADEAARVGTPVIEKHSLAQSLAGEVGWNQPIGQRHFSAVAQALAEAAAIEKERAARAGTAAPTG